MVLHIAAAPPVALFIKSKPAQRAFYIIYLFFDLLELVNYVLGIFDALLCKLISNAPNGVYEFFAAFGELVTYSLDMYRYG